MTNVVPVPGRGAFRAIGKDNGSRWYEFIPGKPLDGNQPRRDLNYEAVHFGVLAIQQRLAALGFLEDAEENVDGVFDAESGAAAKKFQRHVALGVDGKVGPSTCNALWRDLLFWYGGVHHVPASQLYGFIQLESGGDPGAVGTITPDRGLNQWNLVAHPEYTLRQVFDPHWSINATAKRLAAARMQFSGKGVDLKNRCAIAQHNSPKQALDWYRSEAPPSEQIAKYVDLVLYHALRFN